MNDKQREKIRKCLELSKSANENEAANALKLAQSLMRKYGMGDEDIDLINMGKTTANEVVQQKPVQWANALINIICRSFGVDVILQRQGTGYAPMYIGSSDRTVIAAYSFDVVFRLVKKARTEYIKTKTDRRFKRSSKIAIGDKFAESMVYAISSKLPTQELTEKEREVVDRYIEHDYSDLEAVDVRKREVKNEYKHWQAGAEKGRNTDIAVGVDGTSTKPLLLS